MGKSDKWKYEKENLKKDKYGKDNLKKGQVWTGKVWADTILKITCQTKKEINRPQINSGNDISGKKILKKCNYEQYKSKTMTTPIIQIWKWQFMNGKIEREKAMQNMQNMKRDSSGKEQSEQRQF